MSGSSGSRGVVAGGGEATVAAAAEVLEAGGNAVDAALAGAMAAFHVEPLLASAAGGGVMVAGDVDRGFEVLDFTPLVPGLGLESGPARLDFESVTIDFGAARQAFHVGRGAAAVPATFGGVELARRRWGSLPANEIVAPAVRACREGIEVSEQMAEILRLLEPIWSRSEENAALYRVDGHTARAGERLCNHAFAETLERFAEEGLEPFVRGDIADRTLEAFGPGAGGLLTSRDLLEYRSIFREPLRLRFGGGELLAPPPPSNGGTLICLVVALLERSGLEPGDFLRDAHLRAVTRSQLLSLIVRDERLDGATRDLVVELLSDESLAALRERLEGCEPGGDAVLHGRGETTHVSVLDGRGGAAGITVSNGEGCGHVVPGTGMSMNNFLGEADINPGGFHRLPAGDRMATMMSPVIHLRDGRPTLVAGSGGANRLRSAIAQVVFDHVVLGRDIGEAVRAPRIHIERDRFAAEVADSSRDRLERVAEGFPGRDLFEGRSLFFGGVHAVAETPVGRLVGAGDARRGGAVAHSSRQRPS